MELKRASLLFKRHENRTYESLQRKLDKPSNHPIHFAFAKYQVDAAGLQRETNYATDVPKCKHCNAWLFPQEVSRTKWCCNEGAFTQHINQWTQPTSAFRDMCIGTSANAKTFRTNAEHSTMLTHLRRSLSTMVKCANYPYQVRSKLTAFHTPQLPRIPVSKLGPQWRLPTERPHYSRH